MRASVRRASLTAVESGKIAATSGDSATRFVPSAKRAAYLPRAPPEKSMSGTEDFFRCDGLRAFFILFSLSSVLTPCADDTRILSPIGVADDEEVAPVRYAEQVKARFADRVLRIWNGDGLPIRECARRLFERDSMTLHVRGRFSRVPLEIHSRSLRDEARVQTSGIFVWPNSYYADQPIPRDAPCRACFRDSSPVPSKDERRDFCTGCRAKRIFARCV